MSLWPWVREHLGGESVEPPSHPFVGLDAEDDPGYLETGAEERAEPDDEPGSESTASP